MNIKGGYILQPRSFDSSEASKMPPVTRELWFYLLRNVNYSDGVQFKRGQNFFSLTDIQNDLCWYAGYRKMVYSKPQLTKSLRRLNEGNMIATMKATRGIVVTVCNYDEYQDSRNYEGNDGGSTKEPRKKREGHTINKKVKEGKKEEGKEETTDLRPECVSEQVWKDWKKHRTSKAPITKTVIDGFEREAELAGIALEAAIVESIERNWRGFKAEWYKKVEKVSMRLEDF